jgi:hypothetical protein
MRFIPWQEAMRTNVFINGEEEKCCIECMVGRDGWALVHNADERGNHHPCYTCGGESCLTLVRGHVRLAIEQEGEVA